jgi:DNA invertase Pin-like site-specific DNA recombinase
MSDAAFDDYLYARISEDDIGTEKNVARQLRNTRAKSAATNGRVVAEFSDNDISALKGLERPGFEQLMAAITAPNPQRRPRRIVCQHTSRLWRNRGERAHGIDTLGRAKVIVLPIDGPQLDLTTAAGRMVAGMLGEVDTGESETKGERIKDAARERAQEGRANGQVAYGWSRQYQYDSRGKIVSFEDVVDPTQATIVREVVARVMSGESLIAITSDLNRRSVPAPRAGHRRKVRAVYQDETGSLWSKTSVKKLAIRPANIGMRIYHRGEDDEEMLPAAWPAIIDFADHSAVVDLLTDPSRTIERPGSRQHLLTWGLGACGVCGGHLRVARKGNARWGTKQHLYVCEARGCVGRNEAAVDELVTAVMGRLMSRDDAAALLGGNSGVAAQAEALERQYQARLKRAAADYAEGLLEAPQLRVITSKLKPLIEAAKAQAAAAQTNPYAKVAAAAIGEHAAENWAAMNLLRRRAVLKAFGVHVFIDRVTRFGPGFDENSVRVVHRGQDG